MLLSFTALLIQSSNWCKLWFIVFLCRPFIEHPFYFQQWKPRCSWSCSTRPPSSERESAALPAPPVRQLQQQPQQQQQQQQQQQLRPVLGQWWEQPWHKLPGSAPPGQLSSAAADESLQQQQHPWWWQAPPADPADFDADWQERQSWQRQVIISREGSCRILATKDILHN